VRGARRTDHADRRAALLLLHFLEAPADGVKCLVPCGKSELAVLAHHRHLQAVRMLLEVERVTALNAKEITIDAALIAVVAADDLCARLRAAHAERGLAAIAAMRADGAHVVHLPRPRLVAIRAGGQGADGTDVNALSALFALEMVAFVR